MIIFNYCAENNDLLDSFNIAEEGKINNIQYLNTVLEKKHLYHMLLRKDSLEQYIKEEEENFSKECVDFEKKYTEQKLLIIKSFIRNKEISLIRIINTYKKYLKFHKCKYVYSDEELLYKKNRKILHQKYIEYFMFGKYLFNKMHKEILLQKQTVNNFNSNLEESLLLFVNLITNDYNLFHKNIKEFNIQLNTFNKEFFDYKYQLENDINSLICHAQITNETQKCILYKNENFLNFMSKNIFFKCDEIFFPKLQLKYINNDNEDQSFISDLLKNIIFLENLFFINENIFCNNIDLISFNKSIDKFDKQLRGFISKIYNSFIINCEVCQENINNSNLKEELDKQYKHLSSNTSLIKDYI